MSKSDTLEMEHSVALTYKGDREFLVVQGDSLYYQTSPAWFLFAPHAGEIRFSTNY